nr:hypothetical protein [Rhizobium leguminosarum]
MIVDARLAGTGILMPMVGIQPAAKPDRRQVLLDRLHDDPVIKQSLRCLDQAHRTSDDLVGIDRIRTRNFVRHIEENFVYLKQRRHKVQQSVGGQPVSQACDHLSEVIYERTPFRNRQCRRLCEGRFTVELHDAYPPLFKMGSATPLSMAATE